MATAGITMAIGELKEANKNIATAMNDIKNNLKTLNDHNVLHSQQVNVDHKIIANHLQTLTAKYWWLIIALLITILLIMGYKEAIKFLIPGGA